MIPTDAERSEAEERHAAEVPTRCPVCHHQPGGFHWTPPHSNRRRRVPGVDDPVADASLERRAPRSR